AEVRQVTAVSAPNEGSIGVLLLTVAGQEARLWDQATVTAAGPPLRHDAEIAYACAFGDVVVTVGRDGAARVWRGRSGRAVGQPLRHAAGPILFAATNGERLLTVGAGEARQWDVETAGPLGPPEKFGPVPDPSFTGDAGWVRLTGSDGTALSWDW